METHHTVVLLGTFKTEASLAGTDPSSVKSVIFGLGIQGVERSQPLLVGKDEQRRKH